MVNDTKSDKKKDIAFKILGATAAVGSGVALGLMVGEGLDASKMGPSSVQPSNLERSIVRAKPLIFTGSVVSERYVPHVQNHSSVYSFSLDTADGRKSFMVYDRNGPFVVSKEQVDTLIDYGSKVEVEVENNYNSSQFYNVFADKVKFLGDGKK